MVVSAIAIYQIIAGAIAASPFIFHRLRVGLWSKKSSLQYPEVNDSELPKITLVVPAWNEELSIISKLDSLSTQEYPRKKIEVIVIDSNSSDGTVGLVDAWISANSDIFPKIQIIKMERRMGKTTAINQAFSSADGTSDVLAMTDVDARLESGSIRRLGAWFTNPEIGAVGGTPNRYSVVNKTHVSSELSYRGMFTLQRIGESERDSTPFLEGSILGIRRSVFSEGVLDLNCNADDAQLAVATRLSGLRAIQDRDLIFRDSIAPTYAEHRAQKIRRGQGLQRLLWRHRRHWFSRKQGAWGGILGMQAIMHLIVPWLVLIGTVFAILKWCMIIANPVSLDVFVTATLILDSWVFGSWLLFRIGARVPLMSLPATFLDSMSALLVSQFKLLSGESLHMWEQGEGARKSMSQIED